MEIDLCAQQVNRSDPAPPRGAARTSMGSLVRPSFPVWVQILTLEAPKFIQQQCNRLLLWELSQQGTLLGCDGPGTSHSAREKSPERLPVEELCPQHWRHSPPCFAGLVMIHAPSQAYLSSPDVTSKTYFKQDSKL